MKTNKLVPQLRFPEFTEEWEVKELKEIADRIIEKNSNYAIEKVLTNSALNGVVEQSSFFDGKITTRENLNNYFILDVGDFVYNPRISKYAPVGPISRNNIEKGIISPLYLIFRFHYPNTDFYNCFFQTGLWYLYIKVSANKGARFDRISISTEKFMKLPILYPCPKEQQKIADCLTSLDELIELEEKKLSTLQKYKKGLLQKLFPQGKSKIPELRFPEFKNNGEWEEKKLGELGEIVSGSTPSTYNSEFFGGNIPWITPKDLSINKSIFISNGERNITEKGRKSCSLRLLPKNSILFTSRAPIGYIAIAQNILCTNQGFKNIIPTDLVYYLFLYYLLKINKNNIINWGSGGTFKEISLQTMQEIKVYISKNIQEQQKIADFLSSVDELIENQEKKIEQLKQHKKGLLQGLFPNINKG